MMNPPNNPTRGTVRLQRRRWQTSGRSVLSTLASVYVVLLAITLSFSVSLVGSLPVAEILVMAAALPLIAVHRKRAMRKDLIPIYLLMGLWLLGQILTDIYRRTEMTDWVRGDAAICFFALDLAIIAILLSGNERRKILFIAGFAVGSLLAYKLQPTTFSVDSPWKFGLSVGVNLLAVLCSTFFVNRRRYLIALLLLGGISAVNLLLNYRSAVLILLLTIALSVPVIPEQIGPWRILPPPGTRMRLAVLALIALAAGLTASGIVQFLGSRGFLGDEAQAKNEAQSHIKGGILLGGRPEILVSSRAVFDSPILGHGSWARDFKYIEILNDLMVENGMESAQDVDSLEEDSEGVIPGHSHLMTAWIWAGILGVPIWLYILRLIVRATLAVAKYQMQSAPIYMYLFVTFLWDILFSPFGSSRRLTESVMIIIALDLMTRLPHAAPISHWFNSRTWRRGQFQRPAVVSLRSK